MKWMYRFAPLVGAALLAGAAAVPAFASGPGGGQGNGNGSTGRQQVTLFCSNEQQYTVSVPAADGAMGVGQIVDAQGHLIPVVGAFFFVDQTTGEVIEADYFGGSGHQVQSTIDCDGEIFSFTDPDSGDTFVGIIEVQAVLQQPHQ